MEADEPERVNYGARIDFSDPEDEEDTSRTAPKLKEVLEKTSSFLTDKCSRSLSNEVRLKTRNQYLLPKVPATKTPHLDPSLRTEVSASTRNTDRELAKLQSFVLDAMAPLTSVLEGANTDDPLSFKETLQAVSAAVELIGNASAKISRLRREKVTSAINKTLLPIVQDDENFVGAAPSLFGPEDYVDQVKALRSTLPRQDRDQRPFFRGGPPNNRGGFNRRGGRGGAPNSYRNDYRNDKFRRSYPNQFKKNTNTQGTNKS